MRLENLRAEELGERRRIAADVVWETAPRQPQSLFYEVPYPFAADLELNGNAFVLASLPFALWWGERRIQVDGAVCSRFQDALQAVMAIYGGWFKRCRPLEIEPSGGYVPSEPRAVARTASFLSGGVDGLAVLRANRLTYPPDHPESIRDCILLFGANDFENTARGPVPERLQAFSALQSRLQSLAEAADFKLIPVYTNTRLLSGDYGCWTAVGYGPANVSAALSLGPRFTKVLFASDGNGVDPGPGGSHPMLDQHFSTAAVQVQHEQASWTRLDKLRLLGDWPAALALMQPCHYVRVPPAGQINCGHCEKCVRTMLGLALGKLGQAPAFANHEVTPDSILALPVANPLKADLLEQLMGPLSAVGRQDLVRAIQRRLRTFRWREFRRTIKARLLLRRP